MALDSPITATALAGETIDELVWRVLGKGAGAVEAVITANPGLAGHGHALKAGESVLIPLEADAPVSSDMVQLWS